MPLFDSPVLSSRRGRFPPHNSPSKGIGEGVWGRFTKGPRPPLPPPPIIFPSSMKTTGWLFDLYPLGDRMVLWFITATGTGCGWRMIFPTVSIWAGPRRGSVPGPGPGRRGGCAGPIRRGAGIYGPAGRSRWWPWRSRLTPCCPGCGSGWGRSRREVACYNCDLDIAAAYLYSRRYWPCAWYEVEAEDGRLLRLGPREDAFAWSFPCRPWPPDAFPHPGPSHFSGGGKRPGGGLGGPHPGAGGPGSPGLVRGLARWLKQTDPDLVLSDWGDEEIIPTVWRWSREYDEPCPWTGRRTRPPGGLAAAAAIFLTAASSTRAPPPPFTAAGTWTGVTPSTTGNRDLWASSRSPGSARCPCNRRPGPAPGR